MSDPKDPRSESEKARAALKRNDEMGLAVPESEVERRPSVTSATFGGRAAPGSDNDPVRREERDDPLPQAP
jgi:hypothetical protein